MDSAYFAVSPDLVLLAKELFQIRPSALEAGEKRLLLTAQAIASGRRPDRWGHHTEAVIRRFCACTASSGQVALPWLELLEDERRYDGVEGVSSRTGNRPLGTTHRYVVDAGRLSEAMAQAGSSPAQMAALAGWPEAFVQGLLDGRWPSVSEETARYLEHQLAVSVVAPVASSPPAVASVPAEPSPWSVAGRVGAVLALVALTVFGTARWLREHAPNPRVADPPPVELVGYWDYDEIDGQHLAKGLRLLQAPGAAMGARWQRRLELVDHAELRSRPRQLWPVELHRDARRVCINYPDYPTYAAFIDSVEDDVAGVYLLGPCE